MNLTAAQLPRVVARLFDDAPPFDLCLYNAGMDPCEDCALGGLRGITRGMLAERENLVFTWCRNRRLPVAFSLAGGYVCSTLDQEGLVGLHWETLEAPLHKLNIGHTSNAHGAGLTLVNPPEKAMHQLA